MPTLSSTGIGSGLDISGMVTKLVDAERSPVLAQLATKEAKLQAQLSGFGLLSSALGTVKTALDGLNSPTLFTSYKATSADDTRFTATADTGTSPGAYSIEVSSLATAQKLTSGAFTGTDATVGTGTLTLSLGGKSTDIVIDDSNKSLAGIRDAINAARTADGSSLGVTATLVTSTGGSEAAGTYLLLTSAVTGASNTISLTQSGGDGGLAALQYESGGSANALTQMQAPTDAIVKVDGYTYASSSNSVSGALSGVTLNLKAVTTAPVQLTVSADTSGVRARVQALVDAYNAMHTVVQQQGGYNSAAAQGGALIGDPALRNLESQLRRQMTQLTSGGAQSADDIGLSFDSDGKLSLDGAKFDTALSADRGAVAGLLQGSGGLVERLKGIVDGYASSTTGVIQARTTGINNSLRDISDQRDALDLRMNALQDRYLKQFNALDGLLSQITSTGNFLTQQLASLPGAKSSAN